MKMPTAMILCGGQGTRLRDVTETLPKPMVPVGNYPIVWHIMKTYAAFGVKRFILCLGYKRESFVDYFMNYHAHATDVTIKMGRVPDVTYHGSHGEEDWEITMADTGEASMTGARVARAAKYLKPDEDSFFLTYGDGLANVDMTALLAQHKKMKRAITVTAVHPAGRFGEMHIESDGSVGGFHEKPQTESGFINGGYMVLQKSFVERYLTADERLILEQEPMRNAAKEGAMASYEHSGFWQCMDTAREHKMLNELWATGKAPWTEAWK
jgi:glucose-1-phosphate cytidylyltransferase